MAKDPAWKRVVGGLCGIGIMIAVLVLLRQGGASGEDVQQWETAIVFGAAAVGIALWLVKRQRQQ
ncbi:MAG: hypothetical protein HOV81_18745 [Kofleriaceae bacterium]|nr:hypothetical protein [Kofleriaceae bacterium]